MKQSKLVRSPKPKSSTKEGLKRMKNPEDSGPNAKRKKEVLGKKNVSRLLDLSLNLL